MGDTLRHCLALGALIFSAQGVKRLDLNLCRACRRLSSLLVLKMLHCQGKVNSAFSGWTPDPTFVDLDPVKVAFPDYDFNAWNSGDKRTSMKDILSFS